MHVTERTTRKKTSHVLPCSYSYLTIHKWQTGRHRSHQVVSTQLYGKNTQGESVYTIWHHATEKHVYRNHAMQNVPDTGSPSEYNRDGSKIAKPWMKYPVYYRHQLINIYNRHTFLSNQPAIKEEVLHWNAGAALQRLTIMHSNTPDLLVTRQI